MTILFESDNIYLSTGAIDHIIICLMDFVNRESMIQLNLSIWTNHNRLDFTILNVVKTRAGHRSHI